MPHDAVFSNFRVSRNVTKSAPHRRALGAVGNATANLVIGLALLFLGWCVFCAMSASQVRYPVTRGQHAYASRYCVSGVGGALASAYVSKPDLFKSTGPTPRLVIRCTFGPKAYLTKIVELSRSNETPRNRS